MNKKGFLTVEALLVVCLIGVTLTVAIGTASFNLSTAKQLRTRLIYKQLVNDIAVMLAGELDEPTVALAREHLEKLVARREPNLPVKDRPLFREAALAIAKALQIKTQRRGSTGTTQLFVATNLGADAYAVIPPRRPLFAD